MGRLGDEDGRYMSRYGARNCTVKFVEPLAGIHRTEAGGWTLFGISSRGFDIGVRGMTPLGMRA
jgi:hypothetical protein